MKPSDLQATLRILDANANRLREGLRVIEEAARFALNRAETTAQVKAMRRSLAQALAHLEKSRGPAVAIRMLGARDSRGDVHRGPEPGGRRRGTMAEVLTANFKRVQEAARVGEEYAALLDPSASAGFEAIRYCAYDLERDLVPAAWRAERLRDVRLCVLVTESVARRSLLPTVRAALRGGADMIQYRNKELPDAEFAARAEKVLAACRRAGALFIVNDRVDVAAAIDADGVHLGRDDLHPAAARRALGAHRLLGASASTLKQVRDAMRAGADLIGAGAVFPTATKGATGGRAARTRGVAFLRRACETARVPVFAIGGIEADNVEQVVRAGCERIAVCSGVIAAADVEAATRRLRRALDAARRRRR